MNKMHLSKRALAFFLALSLTVSAAFTALNAPVAFAATFTITIQNTVGPGGTVTGGGATCNSSTQQYCFIQPDTTGLPITLTATTDAGMVFIGWGVTAKCTASGNTCTFATANANDQLYVYPTWDHASYVETVSKVGTGSGTVTASSGGINCGSTCSATYATGTDITLTATAAAGSVFAGWTSPGTACAVGGKGDAHYLATATCPIHVAYGPYTAVAQFDKAVSSGGTSSTPKPTPSAAPGPTTTPSPSSTATPVPSAGVKLEVNGQAVTGLDPTITAGRPLVISGVAAPNATVNLFIFSTPRQATVTADAQGQWSYKIEGLEPGSHHVEAQTIDPASHQTSPRATIASFTIAAASASAANAAKAGTGLPAWAWAVIGALVLLAIGGGVWWLRRRSHTSPSAPLP